MGSSEPRSNPWHWHEYPIGFVGEVVRAFVRTLWPFLIGLGGTFVLILGGGILAEENLLGDPGLENAIDDLARFSVGVLMGVAPVVWAGWAMATYLRDVTTSRALVRAAEAGADHCAVPSPEQVESVIREPAKQLTYFAWGSGGLAGLMGIIGLGVTLTEGDKTQGLLISAASLAWAAAAIWFALKGAKKVTAVHERRQADIAAHWSADDEAKAWRKARQQEPGASASRRLAEQAFRPADKLIYLAGVVTVIGFVALQASIAVRCSAVPSSAPQQCDETYYGTFIERILAGGIWIFAGAMVLALVLATAGILLDWVRRHTEADELRERLGDVMSARPDEAVLSHHARRRSHPLARVASALSAFGLVIGASAYFVGEGRGLGSEDVFSVYQDEALLTVLVSAALFAVALVGTAVLNARTRAFRNELMQRWPAAPTWSAGEDGRVLRARTGPALRGSRYEKVGKFKNSSTSSPY